MEFSTKDGKMKETILSSKLKVYSQDFNKSISSTIENSPNSLLGAPKSDLGSTVVIEREVEGFQKVVEGKFSGIINDVSTGVESIENALNAANKNAEKVKEEREKLGLQLIKFSEIARDYMQKIKNAETAVDKVANNLDLKFDGKASLADKIDKIGKKDKENLETLANVFGMETTDFTSKTSENIVKEMMGKLGELVKTKTDAEENVKFTAQQLEEANIKVENLEDEIKKAKNAIDALENTVKSWKIDLSDVKVPEAFKYSESPNQANIDRIIKEFGLND
jgi:chromosome segregation ATPase